MAKCLHCKSCMKIIRVDTFIRWYCPLCDKVYKIENSFIEEKDQQVVSEIKEEYRRSYKGVIN